MLSYQAFNAKHANKFSREGLGAAEKRRRYEDYKQSFLANGAPNRGANGRGGNVRGAIVSAGRNLPFNARIPRFRDDFISVYRNMAREYLVSVLDPWNHKAHIPDPLAYLGVPVSIKWTVQYMSDDSNNLIVMQRPGVTRSWMCTSLAGDTPARADSNSFRGLIPTTTGDLYYSVKPPSNDTSAGGGKLINEQLFSTLADAISAYPTALLSADRSPWQALTSWEDVRTTAVGYRVVSGGMKMSYTGPPTTASGTIVFAPYHADYGLPSDSQASGMFPDALTFDAVATLEGAQSFPAIDGGCVRMLPYGIDHEFKATKDQHCFQVEGGTSGMSDLSCLTVVDPACCDIDAQEYDALFAPGAVVIGTTTGNIFPYQMVGTAAGSKLEVAPFTVSGQETFSGYNCVAGRFQDWTLPNDMTSNIAFATGLPASTDCYRAEFVLNVELIPDSRAFSAVSIEAGELAPKIQDHPLMESVRSFATGLPPVPQNQNDIGSVLHSVAKAVPEILQMAVGCGRKVQAIAPHLEKLKGVTDFVSAADSIIDILDLFVAA